VERFRPDCIDRLVGLSPKAKDPQDILRLQSNFAQTQMQSYARQAQELGGLMVEAMRSSKPKG